MNDPALEETIRGILTTQNLGVLATTGDEYPYSSLVGFAATEDLSTLVFATMRQTRKYAFLHKHPRVSLLINSATNSPEDFKDAASITALGQAMEAKGAEREHLSSIYLAKFPLLQDFVEDPACALIRLSVKRYMVVTRFQDVQEIEV